MPTAAARPHRLKRILIVDDDDFTRDTLRRYLVGAGMAVSTAGSAAEMDERLHHEAVDLLVLDVVMPGEDGLSVCRRLRARGSALPIIMVTGKSEDADRIVGLELGADDYLAKPVNPRELQARIDAVLRRASTTGAQALQRSETTQIRFGPYLLDLGLRVLKKDEQPVKLTSGEFVLLRTLAEHPRTALTRQQLVRLTRGRDYLAFERSLDVQVARLRKLIEPEPGAPRYIQTVWGKGYIFVPEG